MSLTSWSTRVLAVVSLLVPVLAVPAQAVAPAAADPAHDPFGQVDAVTTAPGRVTARGWAIDPDTSGPIIVQMYVDGSASTMTWANRSRPDVGAAHPAAGPNHGYELSLGVAPGRHDVCVYAVNTGPGSSVGLRCTSVVVPSNDPFGQVDTISASLGRVAVSGWAIDPDTSAPIIVQMYVDGTANTMTVANGSRPDVGSAHPGAGPNHGFSLSMGVGAGVHRVCVYAVNTGAGSSRLLRCGTITVPGHDPIGAVERFSVASGQITASGWALDADSSGPIVVQMFVDGSAYTQAWASGSRPDVGRVYPSAGPNHGFTLSMAVGPGQHSVCFFAVNTGAGASSSLGCRQVLPPLPVCSYQDIPTRYTGYGDWQRTLLDTSFMLPSSYAPGDLVSTSAAGLNGGYSVRSLVIPDLTAMTAAARAAGAPIAVVSAYRSYGTQVATFNSWVGRLGYSAALLRSARPGHSEHQLGTTLDFTSAGAGDPFSGDWATSRAGGWMAANAWRHGFVMSYPRGKSPSVTCYTYEPWHYRYVGRDLARAITESGLTLREYQWYHQGNGG